jgi:hypothetical protein
MKMKKFLMMRKLCSMAAIASGVLFFGSCAQDGYDDDERFVVDTWNTQMVTPEASVIKVISNATGDKQTIEWPIVKGAGGFEMKLEDITDPTAVSIVYEGIVDGCSKLLPREEDTKYRLSLRALGNKACNNIDAENTTTKEFSTFINSYAEIPSGTDLYTYFTNNELPAELANEEICYDLVAGGEYTLSKTIEFGTFKVLIRGLSKTNRAKLSISKDAYFAVTAGLRLRAMQIDMSATDKALITGSVTPDESIKGKTGTGDYYNVEDPVTIQNCIIDGVNGNLFYDGEKKYCFKDFVVDNCKIHLTSSSTTNVSGNAIIYCKSGFVNDLTVQNSTFWNTGDSDAKYFIQYNNSGRSVRAGYTTNSIVHKNNTFYNIAKEGQWFNCNGFTGQKSSTYFIQMNIFVDCGNKQISRRILAGVTPSSGRIGDTLFSDNTYWFDGEDVSTTESSYDNGYILTTDPAFKDAANGDFTPTGQEQVDKKTGDPRWFVTD